MSVEEYSLTTLEDHCLLHIITHIDDYHPDTIALLPKHLRLAVLISVAPIHLCWLQQSRVVDGIDIEPVWDTFNDIYVHRTTWSIAYGDRCATPTRQPSHEVYRQYMFTLLHDGMCVLRRVEVMFFGLFEERLPPGVFSLFRLHGECKQRTFDKQYDCYVANSVEPFTYATAVSTLLRYNAIPTTLRIPITSRLTMPTSTNTKVLLHRCLSNAMTRCLVITNTFTIKEHDQIATWMVETVMKQENLVLDLELVSGEALNSLTKHFTAPDGYNALEEIHLAILHTDSDIIPPLTTMVLNQAPLKELSLKGDCIISRNGVTLLTDIVPLFDRPVFRRLYLQSNKAIPPMMMRLLVETFLRAKSCGIQELHLQYNIVEEASDIHGRNETIEVSAGHQVDNTGRRNKAGHVRPIRYRLSSKNKLGLVENSGIGTQNARKQEKFKVEGSGESGRREVNGENTDKLVSSSLTLTLSQCSGTEVCIHEPNVISTLGDMVTPTAVCGDKAENLIEENNAVPLNREPFLNINRDFMEIFGPRKVLTFQTVKFSNSFIRWFCSQPYLCLHSLKLFDCEVDGDQLLSEYFNNHTELHVTHFACSSQCDCENDNSFVQYCSFCGEVTIS